MTSDNDGDSMVIWAIAILCVVWYTFIVGLSITGAIVTYLKVRKVGRIKTPKNNDEGVTILRPLKGLDCEMESCLASSFQQNYPKFELIFCLESDSDPAIDVVTELIKQYPSVDAKIMISDEKYGPNPKINNLAKGFSAAKYDIIWVLDSNVWVSEGTLKRSVDRFNSNPKIALVHHLPLCVSIDGTSRGSNLDEMFMLSSHSKFYTAINFVGIAPCVMGKSNLYRRSVLDKAVSVKLLKSIEPGIGIRHFAQFIAEDNMIAQCIWDNGGRTALTGDSVVQPLSNVSLGGYWSRRVRWLRVRRYMVWAATMIEPTTESIFCAIYGTFGLSRIVFGTTWSWKWILLHMSLWCAIDYWHYHNLLKFSNIEKSSSTSHPNPRFVSKYFNPLYTTTFPTKRPFTQWFPTWLTREFLALPIWVAAMCGQTIYWRNRPFRILHDLSTKEIKE